MARARALVATLSLAGCVERGDVLGPAPTEPPATVVSDLSAGFEHGLAVANGTL
jgi:hypothetical protein